MPPPGRPTPQGFRHHAHPQSVGDGFRLILHHACRTLVTRSPSPPYHLHWKRPGEPEAPPRLHQHAPDPFPPLRRGGRPEELMRIEHKKSPATTLGRGQPWAGCNRRPVLATASCGRRPASPHGLPPLSTPLQTRAVVAATSVVPRTLARAATAIAPACAAIRTTTPHQRHQPPPPRTPSCAPDHTTTRSGRGRPRSVVPSPRHHC
jgi:hypothetical protein